MLFHFFASHFRCMGFHLPSQCTLEAPPAGKCCKVPKCPPNYIINLPPGYVQEQQEYPRDSSLNVYQYTCTRICLYKIVQLRKGVFFKVKYQKTFISNFVVFFAQDQNIQWDYTSEKLQDEAELLSRLNATCMSIDLTACKGD